MFASLRVYVCLCIAPMRCCEWMLKSSNGKAFAHDIHHITQRSVVTRRNSADITAAASIRHDKREIKLLVILAERLENGIKRNTNFYQVRERKKKSIRRSRLVSIFHQIEVSRMCLFVAYRFLKWKKESRLLQTKCFQTRKVIVGELFYLQPSNNHQHDLITIKRKKVQLKHGLQFRTKTNLWSDRVARNYSWKTSCMFPLIEWPAIKTPHTISAWIVQVCFLFVSYCSTIYSTDVEMSPSKP